MRRTNIYLTPLQEEGLRHFSEATDLSMAALARSAINYMLAHPGQFPELHAVAKRASKGRRDDGRSRP